MGPTVIIKVSPPNMYGHGQCHLSPSCFTVYPLYAFLCPHFKLLLLLLSLFLYLTTTLLLVTQAETQNHPLLSSLARSCPTSKYPESCVSYPPTMSQTHPPSSPTTTALGHICSFSYTEQSDYLLTGLLAFNIVSLQLCLQRADLTPSLCRLKLPRPGLQDNTLCTPAA